MAKKPATRSKKPEVSNPLPAGVDALCRRCGVPMRLGRPGKEDAPWLRLAKVPEGVCANCAMTEFLVNTYPVNMIVDERGPEMLLQPAVREAFVSSGVIQSSDMHIDEVNWQTVVANWALPVHVAKNPRNPYRMGEARERREAVEQHKAARRARLDDPFGRAAAENVASSGKEQYCPQCQQALSLPEHPVGLLGFRRPLTKCTCGFESMGAIWVRDKRD
jgi:hypothetical protein